MQLALLSQGALFPKALVLRFPSSEYLAEEVGRVPRRRVSSRRSREAIARFARPTRASWDGGV